MRQNGQSRKSNTHFHFLRFEVARIVRYKKAKTVYNERVETGISNAC